MVIAIVILSILLISMVIYHITYRRQVRGLGRQLAFLNENESNMRVGVDLNAADLLFLEQEINKLNEKCRQIKLECLHEDTALRQTITNISHDIRTPLTSLDGYFQLMAEPGIDEERKLYYLGIIRERISTLNDMLDELFTYAKLQDRNFELEMTETDMAALTADLLMSFYEDIVKNGSEPVIDISEAPVIVNGNKEALCRIEQNIIKNALMHGKNLRISLKTEASGKICFECSNELRNSDVQIDVRRVFDRFYKADSARNTKGSGLGMAIAKELTEKQGGEIGAFFNEERKEFSVKVVFDETGIKKNS